MAVFIIALIFKLNAQKTLHNIVNVKCAGGCRQSLKNSYKRLRSLGRMVST